jgi:hypothetical protein
MKKRDIKNVVENQGYSPYSAKLYCNRILIIQYHTFSLRGIHTPQAPFPTMKHK